MKSFARMMMLVKNYKRRLIWLFAAGVLYGAFNSSLALVIKFLTHILSEKKVPLWTQNWLGVESISVALGYCTIVVGGLLLIGKCSMGYLRRYLRSWLSRRVVIDTQYAVAKHLLSMDMGFFQSKKSGEILSRMTNDMRMLSRTVSMLGVILTEPFAIIFGITYLFYLNWQLAALSFLALPPVVVIVAQLSRKMRKAAKRAFEHLEDATGIMIQFMDGIRTVKSFMREKHEISRFGKTLQDLFNVGMKGARARARVKPLTELMLGIGAMIMLFFGGRWVLMGKMQFEDLMAFYGSLGLMYQPLKSISNANSEAQESLPAAERVFEIFDAKPEVTDNSEAVEISGFENTIEFKDVSFAYNGTDNVIKDINLTINAGEIVALVGPSGAGKSTLADLLARFHDPQTGSITIDNKELRSIKLNSLLSQIAIVSQEPFLFHDTIRENIKYARPEAGDEEVIAAAQAASIHEEILGLPMQYDTTVGDRGSMLSGGQRQRICIARAILKNSPILILDEATSSLDTENERLVQEALEHLMENRTSLVIAHRLSTIRHADKVVVLEDGNITAFGTHDELIVQGGTYAQLWAMQCGEVPEKTEHH
ncbi:MAG: ABC transporter ATP-binding protein [Planctomycetota bacterium]|jgi:subfamily B ATP-binding cassette protein MsbA